MHRRTASTIASRDRARLRAYAAAFPLRIASICSLDRELAVSSPRAFSASSHEPNAAAIVLRVGAP
jgi:hypothetical protein